MLSRTAQRVYWLARYMERAENTARIINVNSNLLFDVPRGTRVGWKTLIEIIGFEEAFLERYSQFDERSVMRFMITDPQNPSSIVSCLVIARENARTTREILPAESWEAINTLYHQVKEDFAKGLGRKVRFESLQKVISSCQQLVGLLSGTMSNNAAYEFIRIGRNLERADMGTRIIDIGCSNFLPNAVESEEESSPVRIYQSLLWMSILVSLSADQMYRQHVQNRVTGAEVVNYLLKDFHFPRAVMHCLDQVQGCVEKLHDGMLIARDIEKTKKQIRNTNIDRLMEQGLHEYMDTLQIEMVRLNNEIEEQWFLW